MVLDTVTLPVAFKQFDEAYYDSNNQVSGLKYEGSSQSSHLLLRINFVSPEGVQISSTHLVWAPPLEYPAGLPDITIHKRNNIWQFLGPDERAVADNHFSHPRIVRTKYPTRDELDVIANSVVASVRSEIEPFNDHLKIPFNCLRVPWRNNIDQHHYVWSFATQVAAHKLKTHPIRKEPNPFLFLWE